MVVSPNFLPNITYDANGNILVNGAPIPGTGPVDLDITPGDVLTNAAGVAYVPSGVQGQGGPAPSLDVDYTDAMAVLNSPFAQTNLFSDSDLDGFEDNTGTPNLFEDLLLQGAATRVGLNEVENTISNNTDTVDGSAGTDTVDSGAGTDIIPTTYTTAQDLLGPVLSGNNLGGRVISTMQDNNDGTFSFALDDGTLLTYDNQGNVVSNPSLETFQYDGTGPFMLRDDIDLYDTSSPTFGSTSIEDIVNFFNERNMGSVGQNFKNQLGSHANAQAIEDSFFNQNMAERSAFRNLLKDFDMSGYLQSPGYQEYLGLRRAAEAGETGSTNNTTDPNAVNYQDLFQNLVQEYQNLLNQQNQPTQTTQTTDMSGLMSLFGGGNPFYRQPSYGYGGGMGYGNPFFGGYGYGYGMNPYAGGIGSFYGNMGSGYSPSMYGSPFYGMYGGQNYNQRNNYMPYNPYSTLYNQYTSPGYTGDMYTTDYQSYLDTPFEGQKYSQDYQDYLSTNNPSVYNNLFGTA